MIKTPSDASVYSFKRTLQAKHYHLCVSLEKKIVH